MKTLLALAILLCAATWGYAAEPSPSSPNSNTTPTIPLAGRGDRATKAFELSAGLVIWDVKHEGPSNFKVSLINAAGDAVSLWINESGSFQARHATNIREGGKHRLQVDAIGDWSITLTQPKPDAPTAAADPFAGKGGDVTRFFTLSAGSHVVESVYKGKGVFRVKMRDTEGHLIEEPVAVLGAYDGSRVLKLEKPGIFFFDIYAGGDWSVTID